MALSTLYFYSGVRDLPELIGCARGRGKARLASQNLQRPRHPLTSSTKPRRWSRQHKTVAAPTASSILASAPLIVKSNLLTRQAYVFILARDTVGDHSRPPFRGWGWSGLTSLETSALSWKSLSLITVCRCITSRRACGGRGEQERVR